MRHSLLAAALLAATVAGCQSTPPASASTGAATPVTASIESSADAKFADLSRRWLDGWMQLNSVSATQLGDHRFDNEVDDLSAAGRQRMVGFSTRLLAELEAMDTGKLSRENQVDSSILRNQLRSDIWNLQTFQSWAWDPQVYNGLAGGAIYNVMARDFAPMPQRLKSATARMEKIPGIFAQMRENLDPARVPAIHAETVAKQNAGILSLVDEFITPNASQLSGADRTRLDAAVASLRKAVADNQAWLDKTLVPNAKGDFRIGQKLYDEKLRFSLDSALSRQEIKQRAEAELKRVRARMYDIARTVLEDAPHAPPTPATPTDAQQQKAIEAALELAYAQHPARSDVVDAAKQALAQATAFVREK
ncbi:MAG TPA: DUF885 family protein, partial [Luteimonas sp.]|nr:DUF885 family protein [Luteimonas sp.]